MSWANGTVIPLPFQAADIWKERRMSPAARKYLENLTQDNPYYHTHVRRAFSTATVTLERVGLGYERCDLVLSLMRDLGMAPEKQLIGESKENADYGRNWEGLVRDMYEVFTGYIVNTWGLVVMNGLIGLNYLAISPDGTSRSRITDNILEQARALEIKISKNHEYCSRGYNSLQRYWFPQTIMQMALLILQETHLCVAYLPAGFETVQRGQQDRSRVTVYSVKYNEMYWNMMLREITRYVSTVQMLRKKGCTQETLRVAATKLKLLRHEDMPRVEYHMVRDVKSAYSTYKEMLQLW